MRCDVIIPVWNQPTFTKDCINSIFENTSGVDYRLVLIDNASDSETRHYLEALRRIKNPPVTVARNEQNLGFVHAVNQGISLSDAPDICILNNDTLAAKGWLREMLNILNTAPDIGVVNPSSNNLGQKPADGEPIALYAEKIRAEAGKYVELGAAIGFCMLIKKEVIEKIGLFDEVYGMGNFEDTDFSRRAVKEGYRCVRACGAYVYHRESSSFNMVKSFKEDFRRNKEIYEFRWGKPRRIAYILDSYDDNALKKLNLQALKLARAGNWIWYIVKAAVEAPPHSNIRIVRLEDKWFNLRAVFSVLRKKKRFDEIFVGAEKLKNMLDNVNFLHKAKVRYF